MSCPARWAVALTVAFASPVLAQPSNPLDLARGLRDQQLPDLALEYLVDLAAKTTDPDLRAEILLETAQARLAVAAGEPDEAKKEALAAAARAEFDRFLTTVSPRHPRRPEAAMAIARATAVQARGQLARAAQQDDPAKRAADAAASRPVFLDASNRFAKAAAEFAKLADDPSLTPARKAAVQHEVAQAELDRALNTAELARAYQVAGGTQNTIDRGKALEEAIKLFRQVAAADPAEPLHWVALAWAAECERDRGSPAEADRFAKEVRDAAAKSPAATAAGNRQLRFFDLRADYLKALADNSSAGLQRSRRLIEAYLAEPASRAGTPTPEVAAARFYLATGKLQEARLAIKDDPKTKQPTVPAFARDLLQQAERDYRKLLETDTDYSSRAARFRSTAIRLLVGDADKPPAAYPTADECLMAAQVQLDKADEVQRANPNGGPELVKQGEKAAALLERVRELTPPRDASREAADAQVKLAFAYLLADRPQQAAVLGEHLARTVRGSGLAARAGYYALLGYLRSANKLDADAAADDRRADRAKALQVARLLDDRYPADPSTDLARLQAADLLLADGDPKGAFDLLGKVPAGSPWAARARGGQATAALTLLRPKDGDTPLSPADRKRVYDAAVAAVTGVPAPPPAATANQARQAVNLALRLVDLHFAAGPASYPKAQQAAERAAATAHSFTSIPAGERDELVLRADLARLRAMYAQAVPLYQARKYPDALARLQPALTDAAKGPAVKPNQPPEVASAAKALDEFRRDRIVLLALQARIREGAADKAGELLALLKTLGGSAESGVAALEQLGAAVHPQAEALRKEGKADEADKLTTAVAGLFEKAAGQPNLSPRALVAIGRGLRENGRYAPAVEVLKKVPAVPADELGKRSDQIDEKQRLPVAVDRLARLELVRTYRLAGKFPEADAALTEALGTKEKPGWAAGLPDGRSFRREAAHLLEAKAAAAPDVKTAAPLWVEARNKWTEQAAEFRPTLQKLAAGKRDPRQAVLVLLDHKALPPDDRLPKTPDDIRKGVQTNPQAGWAKELFAKSAGADSKPHDSPFIQQMHTALNRLEAVYKPAYFDLVYETIRCVTHGTASLNKSDPAKLTAAFARLAPQLVALEQANPDLGDELKDKFAALLDEFPPLKAEYVKQGGKAFARPGQ